MHKIYFLIKNNEAETREKKKNFDGSKHSDPECIWTTKKGWRGRKKKLSSRSINQRKSGKDKK